MWTCSEGFRTKINQKETFLQCLTLQWLWTYGIHLYLRQIYISDRDCSCLWPTVCPALVWVTSLLEMLRSSSVYGLNKTWMRVCATDNVKCVPNKLQSLCHNWVVLGRRRERACLSSDWRNCVINAGFYTSALSNTQTHGEFTAAQRTLCWLIVVSWRQPQPASQTCSKEERPELALADFGRSIYAFRSSLWHWGHGFLAPNDFLLTVSDTHKLIRQ